MDTSNPQARASGRPGAAWPALALRAALGALAALILAQAAFAGQFLSGNAAGLDWHATTADAVLWVAVAQLGLAVAVWRPGRGPAWPAAASTLLLLAIAAQFGLGWEGRVAVHVPLGVTILGATIWLLTATGRMRRR